VKPLDVDELRGRWEGGERLAVLAAEVGLSRSQLWRRIGRPDAVPVDFVTPSALADSKSDPASEIAFVAWAAGFFDGEGCVHAGIEDGPRGLRTHLMVVVAQVVPAPLVALQARWGGSLRDQPRRNPRHRHQWRWLLVGKNSGPFLAEILPYLRVKREVAALALAYIPLIHQRRIRVSDEDMALRIPIINAIRALNRPLHAERASDRREVA